MQWVKVSCYSTETGAEGQEYTVFGHTELRESSLGVSRCVLMRTKDMVHGGHHFDPLVWR